MSAESLESIEKEIYIEALPNIVYQYLTDPQKLRIWMGGSGVLDANPQPGGVLRIDYNGQDVAKGEYLEVIPYQKVVFTWGWEDIHNPIRPGSTTVEFKLAGEKTGTRVYLRHYDLTREGKELHIQGWAMGFPRLKMAAEGKDPGIHPCAQKSIKRGKERE